MGTTACCQTRERIIVTSHNDFVFLGIPEIDDLFKQAKLSLIELDEIKDGLYETEKEMMQISQCMRLGEPNILDAIKVLFWAVSAGYGGNISKSNLTMNSELTTFSMNTEELHPDTDLLYCSFIHYLILMSESKVKVTKLASNYNFSLIKIEKFLPNAEEKILESEDTNSYDAIDMMGILNSNFNKLKKLRKTKVETITNFVSDKVREFQEIRSEILQVIAEADVTGVKAYKKNWMSPTDIFEHLHPGTKTKTILKSFKTSLD